MRVPYCGSDDGTHRTMRRTGRGDGVIVIILASLLFLSHGAETTVVGELSCRSCLLFISLSSMLKRERNDAIPFLSFRPVSSPRLFPICLLDLIPRPPGRGMSRRL